MTCRTSEIELTQNSNDLLALALRGKANIGIPFGDDFSLYVSGSTMILKEGCSRG